MSNKNDFSCLVCEHTWGNKTISKKDHYPYFCPKCKSSSWDFGFNRLCGLCQRKFMVLHIHHIDGNHKNNTKENRMPLCSSCHSRMHNKITSGRKIKRIVRERITRRITELYRDQEPATELPPHFIKYAQTC